MIKVTKTQIAEAIYVTECKDSIRGVIEKSFDNLYWEQKVKYRCAANRLLKVIKLLEFISDLDYWFVNY